MSEDSDIEDTSVTDEGDYEEERDAEELAEVGEEDRRRWVLTMKIYASKVALFSTVALFIFLKPWLLLKTIAVALMSLPLLVLFPQGLGYVVSQLIVNLGTFGYPFEMRYLWILPYFTSKSVHIQIAVRDVGFAVRCIVASPCTLMTGQAYVLIGITEYT